MEGGIEGGKDTCRTESTAQSEIPAAKNRGNIEKTLLFVEKTKLWTSKTQIAKKAKRQNSRKDGEGTHCKHGSKGRTKYRNTATHPCLLP